MKRIVSPILGSNTRFRDVRRSATLLLQPWKWLHGHATSALQTALADMHGVNSTQVELFLRGRDALQTLLRRAGVHQGDIVVLQPLTCAVVPNAILATGATPLYVDVDDTYNIDPTALEQVIASTTGIRAVIVQHTFGQPADIERIQLLCARSDILLIEDCAHALGATHNKKNVGTFGDAAIFSFGRDKVISSVSGGALLINSVELFSQSKSPILLPSRRTVVQHLLHVPIFWKARWLYQWFGLGKLLIATTAVLQLWPRVMKEQEHAGSAPEPQALPNALASLAMHQLNTLPEIYTHRKKICALYDYHLSRVNGIRIPRRRENTQSARLRYTIETAAAQHLLDTSSASGIQLGDWYRDIINPRKMSKSLEHYNYTAGSCPKSEAAALCMINLPTAITTSPQDAQRIIDYVTQ